MKVRYERGALADLEEIFAYIARDNPEAAARLVGRIEQLAARLAEMPDMGEATRKSRFRRFPLGNYLIVYEVGDEELLFTMCVTAHEDGRGKESRPVGRAYCPVSTNRPT
jgi:toxin ParE1/3/4